MIRGGVRRAGYTVITVWLVITVVFFLSYMTGDPVAAMFPDSTPAELEQIREQLGFNRPVIVQYFDYLWSTLRGDLGESLTFRRPVSQILAEHIWPTVQLVVISMAIATAFGLGLGRLAAISPGGLVDRMITGLVALLQSTPPFWSGVMLVLIFSVGLGWLPTSGYGTAKALILPTVTLALYSCGMFARVTRSSLVERRSDLHVLAARARGVRPNRLFRRHVMRNSLPPIVSSIGYRAAELAAGAVVVETIFGWPGIGSVLLNAVFRRDYLLIQGCVLIVALVVVVINLVVDLILPLFDRRIANA